MSTPGVDIGERASLTRSAVSCIINVEFASIQRDRGKSFNHQQRNHKEGIVVAKKSVTHPAEEKSLAQLMEEIDWEGVRRSIQHGITLNMEDLTIVLHDIDRWRFTLALGQCLQRRGKRNLRTYERNIARYKKGNIKRGDGKMVSKKELRHWIAHHKVWIPSFRQEVERGGGLIAEAHAALKPLHVEARRLREIMEVGERYDPRVDDRPGSPD